MISLGKQLFDSMERNDSLCAIKIGSRHISYDELNRKALAIAGFLSENGIINKNVGIITQRSFSAYAGILGAIYGGCTYVPINSKYPEEKISNIIHDAGIQVLICSKHDWNSIKDKLANVNNVKFILFPNGINNYQGDINVIVNNDIENVSCLKKPIDVDPDGNIYVMFTSGSTGKPKGVQVSNKNVLCLLDNMKVYYDLEPGFRASQTFDLSFDLSVSDMFFTWVNGGTLCVLPEEEMYCPAEYINREKIMFWHSVPTLAEFMYKLGFLKPQMFPSLRYSIFCGEPLTQRVANAWMEATPNSTVENLYGPTEATVFVSRYVYIKKDKEKNYNNNIVPIGRSFNENNLVLINDKNEPVTNSQPGELVISGGQVTKGYLNDDKKTSMVYVNMPWDDLGRIWYKTGDLAFINQDGDLEYIGRIDNQIKIAGRRIEIGEIEAALRGQIKGEDAVVVPYRDESGIVQYLVCFATNAINDKDIKEIRKNCGGKIEDLFFPKSFLYIENIPTTISGKIDRRFLEEKATEYL